MKKFILFLTLVVVTVTSAFAGDIDINKTAQANFAAHFAKSTNVKWEKNENYFKVYFQLNGQSLNALFSDKGDLIAESRNILSPDLPIQLQSTLDINLSDNWISELAEYIIDGETRYYVTVENANEKTLYESVGTSGWAMVKIIAK